MGIKVSKPLRHFVDISLSFSPHPMTGDLTVLRDDRAIVASLKNCIMIGVGEKPFNNQFGSNVIKILFEMCDETTARELKEEIERSIGYNEPRVELQNVEVIPKPELNEMRVEVTFKIVGWEESFFFSHILRPTR